MKRITAILLTLMLLAAAWPAAHAKPAAPTVPAPSTILMERDSGTVLAENNADERLAPASITKVMTLLLIMEAIDAGQIAKEDMMTISRNAMNMGGSTACLAEGERYSVHDMLKAVTIQSANDGAVALAEFLSGSEEVFVARMNTRARELGMTNTTFKNCHGLDEDGHLTTARDIALMSRELLMHEDIKTYTTIWMDSLRDGTFMLASTNRLIRYYDGATGLKTGSTSKAGCCISASAERDGMELIAVVMHAGNTDDRFDSARTLLDFGFATYTLASAYPEEVPLPIAVTLGREKTVQPVLEGEYTVVVEKAHLRGLTRTVTLPESVPAPVTAGQRLGELVVRDGDEVLITVPLVAAAGVEKLTFGTVLGRLLKLLLMGEAG